MASAQFSEQPRHPHDELTAVSADASNSAQFLFEPQEREFLQLRWRDNAGPLWTARRPLGSS